MDIDAPLDELTFKWSLEYDQITVDEKQKMLDELNVLGNEFDELNMQIVRHGKTIPPTDLLGKVIGMIQDFNAIITIERIHWMAYARFRYVVNKYPDREDFAADQVSHAVAAYKRRRKEDREQLYGGGGSKKHQKKNTHQNNKPTWVRTDTTVVIMRRAGPSVVRTVYKNAATGEVRVRKMQTNKRTGVRRATYVRF